MKRPRRVPIPCKRGEIERLQSHGPYHVTNRIRAGICSGTVTEREKRVSHWRTVAPAIAFATAARKPSSGTAICVKRPVVELDFPACDIPQFEKCFLLHHIRKRVVPYPEVSKPEFLKPAVYVVTQRSARKNAITVEFVVTASKCEPEKETFPKRQQ